MAEAPVLKRAMPSRPPDTPAQSVASIQTLYDIEHSRPIGKGGFSIVVAAKHVESGIERAVKVMEVKHLVGKQMEMVQHEKEILRRANHPNVVRLHHCIQAADKYYFAMDLMKGDLFDYIVKNKPVPEPESATIMYQILAGIDYLHEQSIVHRDIKPENILINNIHDVKIADLGLAKIVLSDVVYNTPLGTTFYIAPEVLQGIQSGGVRPLCTTREEVKMLDMWACGVVLYIMLSGRPPFAGQVRTREERRDLLGKIDRGVLFPPDKWSTVSAEAMDLILRLLNRDVGTRLTAKQAMEHAFFAKRIPAPTEAPAAAAAASMVDATPEGIAAKAQLMVDVETVMDGMRTDADEGGAADAPPPVAVHAAEAEASKPMAKPKLQFGAGAAHAPPPPPAA